MLSEDVLIPLHNGPFLTIAKILKNVMSSASKYELAGLFTTAKEMVPLRQSIIEMVFPQPKTPIQCNNSTAVGVTNETIVPCKNKSVDMKFHWLCCRELQQQFRYFWAAGKLNLSDYSTKTHPPPYTTFLIGQHIRANLLMLTARVCSNTQNSVTRVTFPSEHQSP